MANKIETMPDHTGEKQVSTRFKPGQSGNPVGRPRGARSKLGEAFLEDLREAWEAHGTKALLRCATEEPTQFVKVVGNLLPREIITAALHVSAASDLDGLISAGDFAKAYKLARSMIGIQPAEDNLVEAEFVEVEDENDHSA